jgi:hypothetical protein
MGSGAKFQAEESEKGFRRLLLSNYLASAPGKPEIRIGKAFHVWWARRETLALGTSARSALRCYWVTLPAVLLTVTAKRTPLSVFVVGGVVYDRLFASSKVVAIFSVDSVEAQRRWRAHEIWLFFLLTLPYQRAES